MTEYIKPALVKIPNISDGGHGGGIEPIQSNGSCTQCQT